MLELLLGQLLGLLEALRQSAQCCCCSVWRKEASMRSSGGLALGDVELSRSRTKEERRLKLSSSLEQLRPNFGRFMQKINFGLSRDPRFAGILSKAIIGTMKRAGRLDTVTGIQLVKDNIRKSIMADRRDGVSLSFGSFLILDRTNAIFFPSFPLYCTHSLPSRR